MWNDLDRKLIYLAALAMAIAFEHHWFAARWKRYERARGAMGVATVLAMALPLAISGVLDLDTLAWLVAAFGVAGAVTTGLYINEAAEVNRRAREIARESAEADRWGTRVFGESDGAGDPDRAECEGRDVRA